MISQIIKKKVNILKLEGLALEDVQQTATTYWTGLSFILPGLDTKAIRKGKEKESSS